VQIRAALLLVLAAVAAASAQIDPVKRELFQMGYNQALEGAPPLSAYVFYYLNEPGFLQKTNLTLRLAIAPTYLDSELGIRSALGENTDLGLGLSGGGFADSYDEIRGGTFYPSESFDGHGGEVSGSLYHLFNPGQLVPLNGLFRVAFHYSEYERNDDTAPSFLVPDEQEAFYVRTGLRWGGEEPTLFPDVAMELSVWYEGQFRLHTDSYGYPGDPRTIQPNSHQFWARALLAYTLPKSRQSFSLNLTAGTSVQADRFSAYRLGSLLPLGSEFPLDLPGYFYDEISARQFVLLGGNYSVPLDRQGHWNLDAVAASAVVDYLPGLGQPGNWNNGVGGGILYKRSDTFKVLVSYAYGIDAIRNGSRGAQSIGILVQLDWEQAKPFFHLGGQHQIQGQERLFN
jgi:hypothetical protein